MERHQMERRWSSFKGMLYLRHITPRMDRLSSLFKGI
jgi:hypothetical protein